MELDVLVVTSLVVNGGVEGGDGEIKRGSFLGEKWRWSWTEMARTEMEPVDGKVVGGDRELERVRFLGGK